MDSSESFIKTGIGKFTDKIIDSCVVEFSKKENKDKVYQTVVSPIIESITARFYPYIVTVSILYIVILSLICIILYLILKKK